MTDAMGVGGPKVWFTAADLADLRLPGLSTAKRKINERAEAERWALRTDTGGMPLARPSRRRGGGVEYHIGVLPPSASSELVKRGLIAQPASVPANDAGFAGEAGQLWSWFDQQTDTIKAEAARRLSILDTADALEASGLTRTAAVASVAAQNGVSPATVWEWSRAVAGAAPQRPSTTYLSLPQPRWLRSV